MTRKLLAPSLAIALAMSGVGIIIPVVPSHIGRLGLANTSTAQVALHVSLLAAGYALMHLLLAPLWGRLSDSLGRRPLLALGLTGFAVGQALCGLVTSVVALYAVRLGSGIFSAAIIPAAFAFVADTTSDEDRTRGMARLSAAGGIGFVIGPAIGGLLGGIELPSLGLPIAEFSLPFFAASGCALLALLTLRWVEEPVSPVAARRPRPMAWTEVVQLVAVARLARRFGEVPLASAALALMGLSLALLATARGAATVFALVASYGMAMGLLTPAVSALVSRRGGAHAGAALGLESGAKSLGQIAGPLLGLAPIFAWRGRRTHEARSGRAATKTLARRGQEAG